MKEYHDLINKIHYLKNAFIKQTGYNPIDVWLKQTDMDILINSTKETTGITVTGMGYNTVLGLNITILEENSPINIQVGNPYIGANGEYIGIIK